MKNLREWALESPSPSPLPAEWDLIRVSSKKPLFESYSRTIFLNRSLTRAREGGWQILPSLMFFGDIKQANRLILLRCSVLAQK